MLSKIQFIENRGDVQEQYSIIEKALDRIQAVLGINDSFLGNALASDSGRKVKIQQNSTILHIRPITTKIEQFYRSLGTDLFVLIKQHFKAHEVLRVADPYLRDRWIEINKPFAIPTGEVDELGQPIEKVQYTEVIDPNTGEPIEEEGQYLVEPENEVDSDITLTEADITIDTTAYNDEDEKSQLLLESVLQGPLGQIIAQTDMGTYLNIAALNIKSVKTKYSPAVAEMIMGVAEKLQGVPQNQSPGGEGVIPFNKTRSQELKLPQNTNEEV